MKKYLPVTYVDQDGVIWTKEQLKNKQFKRHEKNNTSEKTTSQDTPTSTQSNQSRMYAKSLLQDHYSEAEEREVEQLSLIHISIDDEANETAAKAIELFQKRWYKQYKCSIKHWLHRFHTRP